MKVDVETMVSIVKHSSEQADEIEVNRDLPHRTHYSVLTALMSEVGELAEEINIVEGHSYKKPGADGVIGEAIDVIQCALDIIHLNDPSLTEEEIAAIMKMKCDKWLIKLNK